jgi:hypothetical protein
MIRQDSTALLETMGEVVVVYFGPEHWDKQAGGSACGEYAGYFFLNVSESESRGMSIGFANTHTRQYWNAIGDTKFYAHFDFSKGVEVDPVSDWPARPESHQYLQAAVLIHTTGLDTYKTRFVQDLKVPFRGVEFTDTRDGASFIFREDKDINMFYSGMAVHDRNQEKAEVESTKVQLDRFISGVPA